jgi:hypothetical protein
MTTKTRIIMALIWSSLMAPAILLASGCNRLGLSCTQVGCNDQVSVSLRGLEADQFYEVEIATADDIILCTIDTSVQMSVTCDDVLFYSIDRGTASIALIGTPDSVAITVQESGTVIAQEEVRPDYDEVAPNGRACGPICEQAEIPVEL